uniref:NADAR domain-containing protein n=1 Tax=Nocardia concava TaxID=257281 RepID=UPI00247988A5|nr:NADAR domain-containing protein [Nocardia concava]
MRNAWAAPSPASTRTPGKPTASTSSCAAPSPNSASTTYSATSSSPPPTRSSSKPPPRDTIWGIGLGAENPAAADPSQWRGENLLGFALMEARHALSPARHS